MQFIRFIDIKTKYSLPTFQESLVKVDFPFKRLIEKSAFIEERCFRTNRL
jgi:hypothetical protein